MALRNLSDGKRLGGSFDALEDIQRRADSLLAAHRDAESQSDPKTHVDPTHASDSVPSASDPETVVEIKIDLPDIEDPVTEKAPAVEPAPDDKPSSPDPFIASLEALRRTLRKKPPNGVENSPDPAATANAATTTEPPTHQSQEEVAPVADKPEQLASPANAESPVKPAAPSESADDVEYVSALERMPLPSAERAPTPLPQTDEPETAKSRKRTPTPAVSDSAPAQSLDDALEAVRTRIGLPEAENGTRRQPSTPRPRKHRPLSDGIPKSVSEDLPKFRGKPRMRICNRCGHETKLRNPECQNCGKVDESLGILDAVISGDLAKVEQILLVRPHLISVQTSRHAWTLLHMAASGGNRKMVELLIARGAAVNATNRDGKTALHYAAGKGHLHVVESLLLHHADPDVRYHDKCAADLAREHGQTEVENYLRNLKPAQKD